MKSNIEIPKSRITIVGAGPAGASLAIRLARAEFEVTLVEREKFPRHKLCGEFVSPECLAHFSDLGVLDRMLAIGGDRITETCFYSRGGQNVSVPSEWFGNAAGALSISRAEMDLRLFEKAREAGVRVLEETQVSGLLVEEGAVRGVETKSKDGVFRQILSDLTVDATGRANVLGKLVRKALPREIQNPKSKIQNRFVGFKTHLENVRLEHGRCEIYFFEGGYGGLSFVENSVANHCFLIDARVVKKYGKTDSIVEQVIFKNKRAFETMRDSRPLFDWLAVSVDGFGAKDLNPAKNLFAIGDAAAFIDPFTGSGMLMALESAAILSDAIILERGVNPKTAAGYAKLHDHRFRLRLQISKLLRRAAFIPNAASVAITALGFSRLLRKRLARATRQQSFFNADCRKA